MRGGLDLVAACDASRRTILRRQAFSPPIHISKPHLDGDWLVVNVASPSPGLLEGDRVETRVAVQPGARLLLTTPSATRVHTMADGHAEYVQRFEVARDGWLDVWPEYLIPQAGARYRQRTQIRVTDGGTLVWTETIAPGRAARGEVFAFSEVSLATDLFVGDRHILRERYRLTADGLGALRRFFPTAYYGSVICVSEMLTRQTQTAVRWSEPNDGGAAWVGVTKLAPQAWVAKVVAGDSPTMRRMINAIRSQFFALLECKPGALRRATAD